MLAIPAIDLKDGKVVRLMQGRYEEFTVYSHDPLQTAKEWKMGGASRLHIVDLDGAMSGKFKNLASVQQVVENVDLPVQFGGGLRSIEAIAEVVNIGVKWVILGTKACEDIDFIREAIDKFGEQIIVSIDVKYGKVATRGWTESSEMDDVELIRRLQDAGVATFIYTDITRDGTLGGCNIEAIKKVLNQTGAAFFYSGGIANISDLESLKTLEKQGLAGAIIGKALYEDKIPLYEAVRILEIEDAL